MPLVSAPPRPLSPAERERRERSFRDGLRERLPELDAERIRAGEPIGPYTTFQIGGPADVFFEAHSADELAAAVGAAREAEVPYFLLGLGANILVGDLGFRGVVIRNRAAHVAVDRATGLVTAESGAVVWPDLIEATVAAGLGGLEHYAGIPSTVGGALWQNLHFLSPPPDRERTMFIEEVVESAELLRADGSRVTVGRDWFDFGYDYSTLHVTDDLVLSAAFRLEPADPARLRATVEANLEWRGARHPPLDTQPSAGSIFKKIDGVGAGRLADWCGLKGTRIGGAAVTERHANILINAGAAEGQSATARDVRHLIGYVQETVEREQGYRLSTEVGFVGDFGELGALPPAGWEDADGFSGGVPPGGHPEPHRDAERR
ncbi:UDP-N-acetylmuramate dehydrogenase [Rubrivirga sp. S365]|uniref:UDP-N-acetylenolpyruvoylglucosamine reductase n=1 Tax=Rubrivirga litoralis TaxID=3075598 RepID=A0ABU3BU70_9BACT|nr:MULTISPECIES: UDP-N-acetylmuramate dehydrogenase [unclassified Rubrivirga]MDT0632838.1 UDP-N-acetylmuramate dehydrogenase [Rubrivirga sp. F394]MDT7855116.1 UDP-N-acetylmuramate dehydrogenase [Rubrivirga sp. S365]